MCSLKLLGLRHIKLSSFFLTVSLFPKIQMLQRKKIPQLNNMSVPWWWRHFACSQISSCRLTLILTLYTYEALQDTVYIWLPQHWKNYCATFCICWTLRIKMTTTDRAFQWCRLIVLDFCFSLIKCGACPKKVGKMALFGCSEIQLTKFTCILLQEFKRY